MAWTAKHGPVLVVRMAVSKPMFARWATTVSEFGSDPASTCQNATSVALPARIHDGSARGVRDGQ